jgi:CDP-glucose 4,6-dehydratase
MKNYKHIQSKKVLITGHTGFKGSWLSFFLKHLNCEIYGISDFEFEGIYKLTEVKSLFEKEFFIDINDTSTEELIDIMKGIQPDIIFHFAAQSLVKTALNDPYRTIETNSLGTLKILQAANECDSVSLITIATTDKVYKYPDKKNKEDDDLFGYEFYSASKVAAENYIKAFQNNFKRENLNILTIRSGNVIGGGDRGKDRIVTDIVKTIFSGEKLHIRNPGHIRPWTYVLDSLNGYLVASNYCLENSVDEIFNLNSEINNKFDVAYVLNKFQSLQEFNYITDSFEQKGLKEVSTLIIDSTKANKTLKWNAKYELDEIIEMIFNWELHYSKNNDNAYSLNEIERYINK